VNASSSELGSLLADVPPAPGFSSGVRRRAVVHPQDELSSLLSDVPDAPTAPRAASPAAPASTPRRPYGAYDSLTSGSWTIADAPKVKDWFKATYNRDLPVTAEGQSPTHNRMGLDHSDAMDVGLNPTTPEGQAFVSYLKQNNIPYLAYDRAVPGAATNPHIHVGRPSHRGAPGKAAELSSLLSDVPDSELSSLLSDVPDASDDVEDIVTINPSIEGATGKPLALDDGRRAYMPDSTEQLPAQAQVEPSSFPALPSPQSFDPYTHSGRVARDASERLASQPNAREWEDVHLPSGMREWEGQPPDLVVKTGVRQWGAAHGIPAAYVEKWIERPDHDWRLYDLATGKPLTIEDAMGREDIYNLSNRSFRLSAEMPMFRKLEEDYARSRGALEGVSDLATDETHSPVEKLTELTQGVWNSPSAKEARAGIDVGRRTMSAADSYAWAKALGYGDATASSFAALSASDVPNLTQNPAGDIWRAGVEHSIPYVEPAMTAATGNKAAGQVLAQALAPQMKDSAHVGQIVLGTVAQPMNLVPLPEVASLLRAGRLGRAVEEGGELSARVAEMLHPRGLELVEGGGAETAGEVIMRAQDGTHYLLNPDTGEVVNLTTGELIETPPSEWSVKSKAVIEGRNPDEALAEARASGLLSPAPQPARQPIAIGDVVRAASDVINLPKSLKSAFALHGPLRQSAPIAWAHPEFIASAYGDAARAYASGSVYRELAEDLAARPWFKSMSDAGLYMPSVDDVTLGDAIPFGAREERFASRLADEIPGLRRIVRPSERAYLTAQDSMRAQAVENFLRNHFAGPDGDLSAIDFSKINPRVLRAAARDINILSGRGVVPILDRYETGRKIVAALNNPLWSPRALSARLNLISPYRFVMNAANPATRPVAWQQAATAMRALTTLGVTAGLVSLIPGVKFELNPYHAGFGKLSVGDTHYDLLDGIPSTAVFVAKMAKAFYLQQKGETPKKGQEPYSLAADFFRRRESPAGKVYHDAVTGKDANGKPFTLTGAARDLFLQFTIESLYDGWKDSGLWGAVKGLPAIGGVPSSVYKLKKGKRGRGEPEIDPEGDR